MDMDKYTKAYKSQPDDFLQVHRAFARRSLEFAPGQRGFVANGQVGGVTVK